MRIESGQSESLITNEELDMSWISKWPSFGILIIIFLEWGITKSIMEEEEEGSTLLEIISPPFHEVLSGDLMITIVKSSDTNTTDSDREISDLIHHKTSDYNLDGPFILKVLYLLGTDISKSIGEVYVEALPQKTGGNVSIVVPCGFFSRGGIYTLQLQYKTFDTPIEPSDSSRIQARSVIDVKWPKPSIFLESQHFSTYPSKPAMATIKYNNIACQPVKNVREAVYLLQLIYCGSTIVTCYPQNNTHAQILHHEEVRGFQSPKVVSFRCEFFGLPGNYAVRLTAAEHNPEAPTTSVYIKVDWSDEFSFNVHARSIYPCEGSGGVSALFQYPACRLPGDRVRVYGRLRADVTSLASPSSLHYVTELRSVPGKHSLTFDCDVFTERFVEYCFIYVSQAITGAMADVKMSCIPTFPFQESDAAGWGPWSAWSPCSSSCFGGIRNRYRFCDTPPPKYGAKFCQGKAVETEFCNHHPDAESRKPWRVEECKNAVAATRPEVAAEIGVQCRCGCIVTLKEEATRKMLAANTQACPGRSFWLLQTEANFVIGLHVDQLQFPCPGQYFRVRDGDSLNANLLMDVAYDRVIRATNTIMSSGQNLLLEFFSDELTASGEACIGGFLAHAAVIQKQYLKNGNLTVVPFDLNKTSAGKSPLFLLPAHLATAAILIIIFLVSIFLTLQFFVKYRKYRIAEDMDTSSDTSELVPGEPHSISATTSLSDVPSVIEVPRKSEQIEAPCEIEEQYNSTETLTGCNEGSNVSSSTLKLRDAVETSSDRTITSTKSNATEKLLSVSSVMVHSQPKVKYAYPVKLRTLGSCSSSDDNSSKPPRDCTVDEKKLADTSMESENKAGSLSESKDSSSISILSGSSYSSSLKTGKETKDRRNRERLMQKPNSGMNLTNPGSDFSLANPDSELELDYYDYNVANASAVPGSYLGMDPAFLIWIPPLDNADPDDEMRDLFIEPSSKRSSVLTLDTEGAALTPSEYRRMKLTSLDELKFDFESDHTLKKLERLSSASSSIKDENIETRYFDKLMPARKIFEDFSTMSSVESLSASYEHRPCVIPNRLESKDDEKRANELNYSKSLQSCVSESDNDEQSSTSKASSVEGRKKCRNYSNSKKSASQKSKDTENLSLKSKENDAHSNSKRSMHHRSKGDGIGSKDAGRKEHHRDNINSSSSNKKYKDFIQSAQPYNNTKIDSVNIPMIELSGSPLKSFGQARKIDNKEAESEKNIQSPDYGIEMPTKTDQDSFYGVLGDNYDIKFADEDDEYIDQRANT